MDSACVLPSQLFDNSDARMSIFQLSNSLGIEMLDACIELIAIDKACAYFRFCSLALIFKYTSRLN